MTVKKKKKNAQGRPTVKARRIAVGFTLKPVIVAALRKLAKQHGMSRSALVERVLEDHLFRYELGMAKKRR